MTTRSRQLRCLLMAGVCVHATALVWVMATYHGRLVPVSILVGLLGFVLLGALLWLDRRSYDAALSRPALCIWWAALGIGFWLTGHKASALVCAVLCMRDSYEWLTVGKGSETSMVRVARIEAPELAGVVERDSLAVPSVLVEECSPDWHRILSEIRTDDRGRFTLATDGGSVRYLRFSSSGTRMPLHFRVQLSPYAAPLVIRLKPRTPHAFIWPQHSAR